jgi:outer membrane immunogenic protein
LSLNQKLEWFGTVRGRAGVLVSPTVLLYATGGLAYGEVKTSEIIGGLAGFSNSDTRVGYTVGAGIEGVIGGNWTAKLEYLYVDLGRTSGSFLTTIPALGGGFLTSTYRSRITDNVLRVGLNYKFGGPVVAKY